VYRNKSRACFLKCQAREIVLFHIDRSARQEAQLFKEVPHHGRESCTGWPPGSAAKAFSWRLSSDIHGIKWAVFLFLIIKILYTESSKKATIIAQPLENTGNKQQNLPLCTLQKSVKNAPFE
jgi:hypothetical protein